MTISLHEIEAWVGTQKVGVKEASITMDETWAPYVQGSLTTVLDMDLLDALDPRTGARLKVFATQEYGVSDKISSLTNTYNGQTISSLTNDFGGTGSIAATNLCTNPSFETNTAGWGAAEATISCDTTQSYSGVASLKAVFSAIAGNGPSHSKSVTASQTYVAAAWVKGEPGKKLRIRLLALTAAGSYIGETSSGDITATGAWQRITVSRAFGATSGQARIHFENRTAGPHTFFIDAVQLEIGSTVSDYFDGSTIQNDDYWFEWSGTAHASTSYKKITNRIGEISAWYFAPFNQPGSNKLDTLSSIFSGGTIAGMTTAWAGLLFSAISEKYYRSYPDGLNNNYRRGFDLTVRSRELNLNDGTMTFQLASDEALLQDYALVQSVNYAPASLDLRTIVKEVLSKIGGGLVPGTDTAIVSSTAAIWPPGQTAWDYLQPLIKNVGLRLYCDEQRMWHLNTDTTILDGLVELFSVGTIKTTSEVIDRNAGEWFDAVVIKYTYVNDLGATVTAYDTANVEKFKKVKLIEYQSAYPGPGAAQRILNRAIARGRQQDVNAVSNYAVSPTTACTIYITGYPTLNNYIQAVTWNFPSDEMTIKTRQPVNN
jgi:hypothetical protein